jgi:serpin B
MKTISLKITSFILATLLLISLAGCRKVQKGPKLESRDLMQTISDKKEAGKDITDNYKSAIADASIQIFKTVAADQNRQGKNTVLAPLGAVETLSMLSNGATGATLEESEQILFKGISLEDANSFNSKILNGLNNKGAKLSFANSLWINNNIYSSVKKPFLKSNAKYYGFDVYKSDFTSDTFKKDVSVWSAYKTNDKISKLQVTSNADDILYAVNAVTLDGKWKKYFDPNDSFTGNFENYNGDESTPEFMMSIEDSYIEDGYTKGFVKQYDGGNYSFVALLPNEQISLIDYINMLDGDTFLTALDSKKEGKAIIKIPKFSDTYQITLRESCQVLGLTNIFSSTDAQLDKFMRKSQSAHLSEIFNKTSFTFDDNGTSAFKPNSIELTDSEKADDYEVITFERPFFYAVIDNNTNLPLIIGTVLSF